jgi:prefoldin subunit 5
MEKKTIEELLKRAEGLSQNLFTMQSNIDRINDQLTQRAHEITEEQAAMLYYKTGYRIMVPRKCNIK